VQELVIELDASFQLQDNKTISAFAKQIGFEIGYRHSEPHLEPLLWAADIAAWAANRGLS
jgi:hypothetical protein